MSFYQVPQQILNPVLDLKILSGKIVLPTDLDQGLARQLTTAGFDDFVCADDYANHIDRSWWQSLPCFDWTIAITQGMGESIDWILEPGYELSKKGLIVLDRITFLEPTRKRFRFLQKRTLSNLVILNPRPEFRADQRKSKDSVTSAWFIYNKESSASKNTNINFDVNWQRPQPFSKSERTPTTSTDAVHRGAAED
tara:strand:- start:870 stop:1457 length:588 start_codon:yes stop_codon:yes gene_type:complete